MKASKQHPISLQLQRLDTSLRIMCYYKWHVNQTQLALEPVITCCIILVFPRLFFWQGQYYTLNLRPYTWQTSTHLLSSLKTPLNSKGNRFPHLFYHCHHHRQLKSLGLGIFFFFKDRAKVDLELKILLASPRITDAIHHFWVVLVFCF